MQIGFLIFPMITQLDATGPAQILSQVPGAKIHLIWKTLDPVPTDAGFSLLPTTTIEDSPPLDVICIPGGAGQPAIMDDEVILDFVRRQGAQAKYVTSVCTGSLLLAKAGLLDGLPATSNKMYFSLASTQSDAVAWKEAARWVDAGQYVTSSGVSAGTDMALAVIARLFGAETAETVARFTEYQWHTDADDDPFKAYLNQAEGMPG